MTTVSQQDIDLTFSHFTSECATSFPGFFITHPRGTLRDEDPWIEVVECVEGEPALTPPSPTPVPRGVKQDKRERRKSSLFFTYNVHASRFALQVLVETPTTVRSILGLVGRGA